MILTVNLFLAEFFITNSRKKKFWCDLFFYSNNRIFEIIAYLTSIRDFYVRKKEQRWSYHYPDFIIEGSSWFTNSDEWSPVSYSFLPLSRVDAFPSINNKNQHSVTLTDRLLRSINWIKWYNMWNKSPMGTIMYN